MEVVQERGERYVSDVEGPRREVSKCQASGTDDGAGAGAAPPLLPPRQPEISSADQGRASAAAAAAAAAAPSASLSPPSDCAPRHAPHGPARIHSRHRPGKVNSTRTAGTSPAPSQLLISRLGLPHSMGICSSCLGGRADEEPSDASQLLGDSYQPQYGTLDARPQHPPQPDPEEIRREREELEQICADTSSQLITVVQPTAQPDADQPQVSETTDYAQHFSKRFPSLRGLKKDAAAAPPDADVDEAAWLDSVLGGDEDGDEPVKAVQGGLTRQFGK